jgi:hypothetical protein
VSTLGRTGPNKQHRDRTTAFVLTLIARFRQRQSHRRGARRPREEGAGESHGPEP